MKSALIILTALFGVIYGTGDLKTEIDTFSEACCKYSKAARDRFDLATCKKKFVELAGTSYNVKAQYVADSYNFGLLMNGDCTIAISLDGKYPSITIDDYPWLIITAYGTKVEYSNFLGEAARNYISPNHNFLSKIEKASPSYWQYIGHYNAEYYDILNGNEDTFTDPAFQKFFLNYRQLVNTQRFSGTYVDCEMEPVLNIFKAHKAEIEKSGDNVPQSVVEEFKTKCDWY